MNILSIQSWVSYGHVGNSAAMFPLQRLGAEVWAVNTVLFSNHTGYGQWRGQVFDGDAVRAVVEGIAARGVLPDCQAVLSGYMGDVSIGEAILDATRQVRAANPQALYCCDPVIGDIGRGVFVRPDIPDFMRERAVPAADIVTPNQFELELLTGHHCTTTDETRRAIALLQAMGPRCVLLTSLITNETPVDALDLVVAENGEQHLVRTPRLPMAPNGAGDAIAALFLFHRLRSGSAVIALTQAASAVYSLLRRGLEAGCSEIPIVTAQEEFIHPSWRFEAQPY